MKINQQLALSRRLGIDVWAARKPLLGAAQAHRVFSITESVQARTQALNTKPHLEQAAVSTAAQNRSKKSPQNRAAELSHSLAMSATPTRQSAAASNIIRPAVERSVAAAVKMSASLKQEFSLVGIVSGDLLLVDDVSGLQLTASTYTQWLNALLVAVAAEPLKTPLSSQNRISWPLVQHAHNNDASEMISAWLKKKLDLSAPSNQPQRVLIMGAHSAALLANNVEVGTLTTVASLNSLPALVTLGTKQLWAEPLSKKLFWQHLQLLNG